ncbi:hypothetical protein F5B22DRAFT_589150 [Xylaria bambusicola]|uniref:uncharacterized protein n=1 Tax=Xylaria bambusicola TaxID=326684 RepID=UPI002008E3B6|nr:uncharacterized protein F5B22DRAFT_589150 [Xylaria bambusicola]KAI0526103.1 hypothetical protein F5B22DRAFT_589150 [Xylaria bambusicola]
MRWFSYKILSSVLTIAILFNSAKSIIAGIAEQIKRIVFRVDSIQLNHLSNINLLGMPLFSVVTRVLCTWIRSTEHKDK